MNDQLKPQRGGARQGAGRKANDRNFPLHVRISREANDLLARVQNKSEYIDNLIRNHAKEVPETRLKGAGVVGGC